MPKKRWSRAADEEGEEEKTAILFSTMQPIITHYAHVLLSLLLFVLCMKLQFYAHSKFQNLPVIHAEYVMLFMRQIIIT